MKDFAVYTALRIGLFIACYAILAGLWMLFSKGDELNLLWPFVGAFIVWGVLSLKLLQGPRERFAQRVQDRAARASAKMEEIRSREDQD